MTNEEAIKTLEANYPDACYEQLREAVDTAISALKAQQAAGDTISRAAALEACYNGWNKDYKKIAQDIKDLPPAQPQRTGRWIPHQRDVRGFADEFECSECERIVHFPYLTRICDYEYCPYCNAKME